MSEKDQTGTETENEPENESEAESGPDTEPVYNDRDKLDFDPEEGLLSGTAIHGGTEIPGEHDMVDDVEMPEEEESGSDGKSDDDEA